MAILYSPESEYAKESVKWEARDSALGPGQRPYVFHEFPKRLYKAGRNAAGVPVIVDSYEAESSVQEANLRSRGYYEGQDKALEALHAADQELALLAANRAFTDRTMSAAAQTEAAGVDAATSRHLAEIPALPLTPRNKGGRPKKLKEPHASE